MRHRVMKRMVAGLAVAGIIAIGGASAAWAAEPMPIPSGGVVDETGVLDVAEVEDAIAALESSAGVHLLVAFVDDFGGEAPQTWTETTAELSGATSPDDIVLAVGLDLSAYWVAVPNGFPLSDDELSAVEEASLLPGLRSGDFTDAVVDYAGALGEAMVGGSTGGDAGAGGSGGASDDGWVWIVIGVLVVGAIVLVIWLVARSRRARGPAAPQLESQESLERRAGQMLVELDDAVRSGEEELGFAQAQFGDEAAVAYRQAIDQAKAGLREAFTIQQRLDDAYPESPQDARTMVMRIIELAESAGAALDAQSESFDDLRALEQHLPSALPQLDTDRAAAEARVPAARTALDALAATYAPAAIAPVSGNVDQASSLLAFVDERRALARQAVAAGDTGEAALAVHDAQTSLVQVGALLAAIDEAGATLAAATAQLEAATADLRKDVADAGRFAPSDAGTDGLDAAVTSARAALDAVDPRSPAESIARIQDANASIDHALGSAREAKEQVARAISHYPNVIAAAKTQISNAMQFISTRRGGIGSAARTRISEADSLLNQAMARSSDDPVHAVELARRAQQLGAEAYQLAQRDVDGFQSGWPGAGGGGWSGGRGGGGIDFGSVLGGILGGVIGSGMRGGGGGGWSSGGGGIFRGGGGGFSGGGFRGGGGGFSGGFRGGGGRF